MISRIILLLALSSPAWALVKVVTTTPDLAWAARRVGGDKVEVVSLLNGTEDPHHVDTVPSFIVKVADADVVCVVGLELEIGWIPKVLSRSGNSKVQPGGPGYCETGKAVSVLEKPEGNIDRSMGDVHPGGNPHFWLSPKGLSEAASEIRDTLVRVDPASKEAYQKNYSALSKELSEILKAGQTKLKALKRPIMEYHKEFSYFIHAYRLKSLGSLEEKPGVPPSAGRIAKVSIDAKNSKAAILLAGKYAPEKVLNRFQEASGVPVLVVSTSLEPDSGLKEYADFQNRLIDGILKKSSGN